MAEHYRERDISLERYLTSIAAQATGHTKPKGDGTSVGDTGGLDEFADRRALPGGVRAGMDYDREMAEEIADARNYAVWGIEPFWAEVRAGESRYTSDYERRMRSLSHLIEAWHALHDYGP
jgi:hypothetical protein